jgi:hypothetical protein
VTAEGAAERRRLRLGSLALFVGAPVLLLSLTVSNLLGASDGDARATRQEALLGEIERRVAGGGAVALPVDTSALYLAEMSDTLARAELQQLVVGLVARSSGRLIEAQGGDEPAGEDSRQVQVRVTLDTTHEGLFDLLHGIETGLPLLTVKQVGLRKLPGPSGSGDEVDPLLRATLAVTSHWKGKGD